MVSLATSVLGLSVATVVVLCAVTRGKTRAAVRRRRRAVHRPSQVLDDAYHLRS